MVREGSVVFGIWKMGEDPLINIFLPVLMELGFHIFHYTPFIHADNARPFPWSRKSHIFWFWPLCFAAVRVSSHTGNYGCGESSRVRAAQGVFDQPVPRL